ncbi:metal-dependent hydrolase [Amycolatopsis antarctica]|uniref:Metal-dependent hydrolase n=1 Tax=Amycolatopsis antarctica TaxID=1854586 RepID=A0A263D758_9PSEU|nr:amidohydrolase family protein [Amycolatopsis antarctica]OZM74352.1 metal-dependent hydrolase [Amycolatopsis antarctica]
MIDVHTHCHLSEHWGCEWHRNWKPVYGYDYRDWTPEEYDAAMSGGGVDLAFVFGLRASRAGVRTPNEYVQDFCARTETPTVGFMALDLADEDLMTQLADGIARGLRGVKLYPVLAHFDPRDEAYDGFYRAAADAGLVLLWHMGATPSPEGRLEVSQPLVVDEVARRHPGLVQIIAHLGHPWQRESIVTLRKNRNVYADVSGAWARPMEGYFALARAQEWEVVPKLLFGSDFPLWTPAEAAAGLRSIADTRPAGMPGIRPETLEWLLDGDPREALGIAG